MTSTGGELFTDYSDHPRKLVTLNPNSPNHCGAGRYQLLSRCGMPTASSLAWKTSSPKSQDAVALQQIKERGALLMIDRGDIRCGQIDRCSNIRIHCRALVMAVFRHKADSPTSKIQRSGRNGQRDWCMSRVTAIISALVICIIVCLSWPLIITVITPLPQQKAQRDKNARELKLANAAITDMQMRQRDVAGSSMQNTRRS